ncbi:hypothetical protein F0562_031105 [Nyssa sinensis]|uniref:Uncharacterized protein n=1 Tax=Nyssa sinensis TaxID=561372 RepID=A0A5J5AWZ5_9ASTE|nr:hypothetical protein F0562_031105 [Nyssa sinensis]
MSELARRFRVGYALEPKKVQSFIQPSLVDLAKERGVDLILIDTNKPLIEQDAIERLHYRVSMLEVVAELKIPQENQTIGIPKQIVFYDSELLSDYNALDGLKFPVIAKPLAADGSAEFAQHISNSTYQNQSDDEKHVEEADMPPLSFIIDIANGLRRAMRLHLFNFDMIRDSRARNRYLVIDINYFPGFAKMPSYETVLTDFLLDIMHKKQSEAVNLDLKEGQDSCSDCRQIPNCDEK